LLYTLLSEVLLFFMSKTSWLISEMVFSNSSMSRLVLANYFLKLKYVGGKPYNFEK